MAHRDFGDLSTYAVRIEGWSVALVCSECDALVFGSVHPPEIRLSALTKAAAAHEVGEDHSGMTGTEWRELLAATKGVLPDEEADDG